MSLQASHGLQTRSAKRHEPHLSHNLPLLEENSGKKHPHIIAAEIDRACSEVPLGERVSGGYILAFGIGTDLYAIDLSDSSPGSVPKQIVEGTMLQCIHYSKSDLRRGT